jgi:HPt (histidine-containing phosphotransfer) domain-containing protein
MNSPPQPGAGKEQEIAQAVERMWTRFLPEIRDRAAVLAAAAAAAEANQLTREQRETAHATAHKLAGTLGMFDLARGTELARQFESSFTQESGPDREAGKRLAALAAELRAMIESRPRSG